MKVRKELGRQILVLYRIGNNMIDITLFVLCGNQHDRYHTLCAMLCGNQHDRYHTLCAMLCGNQHDRYHTICATCHVETNMIDITLFVLCGNQHDRYHTLCAVWKPT